MAEPGQKSFLTQRQEVAQIVLNESAATSSTFPSLAMVKAKLNDKMRQFQASRDWTWARRTDETITLATGTADYSAPDNARMIGRIADKTSGNRLRFVTRDEFERSWPKGTSGAPTGSPNVWSPIDPDSDNTLKFRVRPTPSSSENGNTLTMMYWKRHVDLSGDTDTSDIPVEFQDIPIYQTCAELFNVMGDHEEAMVWEGRAQRLIAETWARMLTQTDHVDTVLDPYDHGTKEPWPMQF